MKLHRVAFASVLVLCVLVALHSGAGVRADSQAEPGNPSKSADESTTAQDPPEATRSSAGDPEDERDILHINLEEREQVNLVEFKIMVTDRKGRPVSDLAPEEVRIFEGEREQSLAFLEPVSSGAAAPTQSERPPQPAVLYGQEGEQSATIDPEQVLPPKPVRRIVLAFDVRNSKLNSREKWQEAALDWLDNGMQPEDRVAIVIFRSFPDWVVPFTDDRKLLTRTLETISIVSGSANRDRSRDMSRLVEDIRSLCTDPGRIRRNRRFATERHERQSSGFDETSCSYNITEGFVAQWDLETKESVDTMRTLAGQLAAIPGRKTVILFSEGIIADPSTVGVNAMLSVFGTQKVDMSRLIWRLDKNAHDELNALHHAARAAEVAFFTLDTRQGHDYGFGGDLESGQQRSNQSYGINPWSEMHYETRQTLAALAKETGGRSFYGVKNLDDDVRTAANSFYGMYSVGFYREDGSQPLGRVQVKIERRKLDVDYPDRIALSRHQARQVMLHMTIARPTLAPDGTSQRLPVTLTMEFDQLPLRTGAGGRGTQLGALIQAIRPDGSIAAEKLEIVTVVATREERQDARGKAYSHRTSIDVPEGAYRIRARLSDDRQRIVGDQAVDLTVRAGAVEPGIRTGSASGE